MTNVCLSLPVCGGYNLDSCLTVLLAASTIVLGGEGEDESDGIIRGVKCQGNERRKPRSVCYQS